MNLAPPSPLNPVPHAAKLAARGRLATPALLAVIAIVAVNTGLWWAATTASRDARDVFLLLFSFLALAQLILGLVAAVSAFRVRRWFSGSFGILAALGAAVGWLGGIFLATFSGGAWGRPLRVRGRQLHPELKRGSEWTRGERPNPAGLDEPTRAALEALWLHDAQKEHASVPAFSRVSWMLAAAGAPAELLEWSHRAALEEIEHTRLCFALAAGYGDRTFTVEPMPDLLLGGLDVQGNALAVLAGESLSDGCQLEDFNADVAAACAEVCAEPATKQVLETIAREERTHADFSWAVVEWLLAHDRVSAEPALREALAALDRYPRPTAVSSDKAKLVAKANPALLLSHGRLPDARWAQCWEERLAKTRARLTALLAQRRAA